MQLAVDQVTDYPFPLSPAAEEVCYTELQPSLVATYQSLQDGSKALCYPSNDIFFEVDGDECAEIVIDADCLGDHSYIVSNHCPQAGFYQGEFISLSEVPLLNTRLAESAEINEDDDDASVMLEVTDLSFLDEVNSDDDEGEENTDTDTDRGTDTDTRKSGPAVVVTDTIAGYLTPPQSDSAPSPVSSPSPPSSPLSYTPTTLFQASDTTSIHFTEIPRVVAVPAYNVPLHYYDIPTVVICDNEVNLPPTPSASPSSSPSSSPCSSPARSQEVFNVQTMTSPRMGEEEDMEDEDDDDDDDAVYKPYCDSRRGAKRNLLWKFLLWVLDRHSHLAKWTDMKRGEFKFVDTSGISTLWGRRKNKKDMTFEKLSRGIRHYYKLGLMERLASTRLVYRFNWEKVPKKYRKA